MLFDPVYDGRKSIDHCDSFCVKLFEVMVKFGRQPRDATRLTHHRDAKGLEDDIAGAVLIHLEICRFVKKIATQ